MGKKNSPLLYATLAEVVMYYPVEPRDTLRGWAIQDLARRGYIVRDSGGRWIPRAAGVEALSGRQKKKGG